MITQTIIPRLFTPFGYIILAAITTWLAAKMGNQLWPQHWDLIVQLFLALLIAEFGRYWVHRWTYTVPVLWRFYAILAAFKVHTIYNSTLGNRSSPNS